MNWTNDHRVQSGRVILSSLDHEYVPYCQLLLFFMKKHKHMSSLFKAQFIPGHIKHQSSGNRSMIAQFVVVGWCKSVVPENCQPSRCHVASSFAAPAGKISSTLSFVPFNSLPLWVPHLAKSVRRRPTNIQFPILFTFSSHDNQLQQLSAIISPAAFLFRRYIFPCLFPTFDQEGTIRWHFCYRYCLFWSCLAP